MLYKRLHYLPFLSIAVLNLMLIMTSPSAATTGEIGVVTDFAVSPNGERVIFVSMRYDGEGRSYASVMLLDLATMDVTGLTEKIVEAVPSPDGQLVAYIGYDRYHGDTLWSLAADGSGLKLHYHQPNDDLKQLRWSKDSKYFTIIHFSSFGFVGVTGNEKQVVFSLETGVVSDSPATVEWQEPASLPADHPLYREEPTVRIDSSVLWENNKTVYVQAVDGIWKGSLDVKFTILWERLVTDENIRGTFSVSAPGSHLLYERVRERPGIRPDIDFWLLPLADEAVPIELGDGWSAQFTPNGQHVLLVNIGLWMIPVDGSPRRKVTVQTSQP